MIHITFGETYEVQSTFNWYGTIDFTGHECPQANKGLMFWSKDPHDIKIAHFLQEKFPELLIKADFYTEEKVEQVILIVSYTARFSMR